MGLCFCFGFGVGLRWCGFVWLAWFGDFACVVLCLRMVVVCFVLLFCDFGFDCYVFNGCVWVLIVGWVLFCYGGWFVLFGVWVWFVMVVVLRFWFGFLCFVFVVVVLFSILL